MAKVSVFICALYVLMLTSYSMAMSKEQKAAISQFFHELGMECIKDHPISADDITNMKAKRMPTGPAAPCFLACMFKSLGIIDKSGMVQHDSALELAKTIFEDPEELKAIEDYLNSCTKVNDQAVSDGDKGCDRAMLSFKCMTENAAQFGFDV